MMNPSKAAEYHYKRMLRDARSRAKRKSVGFAVILSDLADLWHSQNGMCALSGTPMQIPCVGADKHKRAQSVSLDRITPSVGYVPGNIQLTTRCANNAKSDMPVCDFITMCSAVTKHNQQRTPK